MNVVGSDGKLESVVAEQGYGVDLENFLQLSS